MSASGYSTVSRWCAIAAVGPRSGSPRKRRLRLPPSSGETRSPAIAAGRLSAGRTITRPFTAPGSSARISLASAIWPSYSSPWLPAVSSSVGPAPFFTTAAGIAIVP